MIRFAKCFRTLGISSETVPMEFPMEYNTQNAYIYVSFRSILSFSRLPQIGKRHKPQERVLSDFTRQVTPSVNGVHRLHRSRPHWISRSRRSMMPRWKISHCGVPPCAGLQWRPPWPDFLSPEDVLESQLPDSPHEIKNSRLAH